MLTILGIALMGDRADQTIYVQNRARKVLYVAESAPRLPRERRYLLDPRWTRRVPLFEVDVAGGPTAVALFPSQDAPRAVAVLRIGETELNALRMKKARIAIEEGPVLRMRVVDEN